MVRAVIPLGLVVHDHPVRHKTGGRVLNRNIDDGRVPRCRLNRDDRHLLQPGSSRINDDYLSLLSGEPTLCLNPSTGLGTPHRMLGGKLER